MTYRLFYVTADGPDPDDPWSVHSELYPNADSDTPIDGTTKQHIVTLPTEAAARTAAAALQQSSGGDLDADDDGYTVEPTHLRIVRQGDDEYPWQLDAADDGLDGQRGFGQGTRLDVRYTEECVSFATFADAVAAIPTFLADLRDGGVTFRPRGPRHTPRTLALTR